MHFKHETTASDDRDVAREIHDIPDNRFVDANPMQCERIVPTPFAV
jgi:hypothetical protein